MGADLEAPEHEALLSSRNENSEDNDYDSFPPKDEAFTINVGQRPNRDTIFKFLFLGTILLTYGIGIMAFTRADFNILSKLQRSKFNPATNECELGGASQDTDDRNDDDDGTSTFLQLLAVVSLSALVMTLPVGLVFFWLLHRYTRGLVMVMAPFMSMVPLGICVCGVTWCYGISDICATAELPSTEIVYVVYMSSLSALMAYQVWKNFSTNSFEVAVELLKMATKVLKDHVWVLVLNSGMMLGSMVLVNGPIFTFIWYAVNNRQIVPNFNVVNDPSRGSCDNATGYPCCREQNPAWVSAYIPLAFFTVFWVQMVTVQLQVLVVSGTIAHWYFVPQIFHHSGSLVAMSNIKRSLRNAFGPSFGTACNLGTIITILVVAIVGLVKKATNRVLNSNNQGIISSIVRGCVSWMSEIPECNPRFATNFAAISGESFWESSKKANHLLQRNSLLTTGSYSPMVHYTVTSMTFFYGILHCFVVYYALEYFMDLDFFMAIMITALSFCITSIGLLQFPQAITSVIDTVYICYAMEKDVGEISKPEVCHAYTLLPPENETLLSPEDNLNAP